MTYYPIKENDIVDIVEPSTSLSMNQIVAIKKYVEQELNLVPRFSIKDKNISRDFNDEFPVFSAKVRFEEFYEALKSDSKIIWCARGGYGSGDLLPFLDKIKKIKQNKIFIGFSDIVSIANFLQQKWHWDIISAPMLLQLAERSVDNSSALEIKDLIFGRKDHLFYCLNFLNRRLIKAKNNLITSKIVGGCLSVICGHFGGRYQIDFSSKILFLEDEGEDGERLDRYFRQIIEVVLKTKNRPQAILLGNFSQANPHGIPRTKNIDTALKRFIDRVDQFNLNLPVFEVKEKNLGHSYNMRPLVLGLEAEIDIGKSSLVIANKFQ